MKAIIFDTETTGLVEPEVIEIAWRGITDMDWTLRESFEQRFKNSKPIEWGALATHHILPSELEHCAPATECKLPEGLEYIIGHNVDFDWGVMGKPSIKRIDTLALCRSIFPKSDSHKLGAMYYYLAGAKETSRTSLRLAHSALADVNLCGYILMQIVRELNLATFEELYKASEEARIPKIMTFGKFRGQPVSDVDRGWASWYRRQTETDPYLLMALSRYVK